MSAIAQPVPSLVAVSTRDRRRRVYVDASRDPGGLTALAYTGSFGDRVELAETAGSVEAELEALLMAMQVARVRGLPRVTFHTDCAAVAEAHRVRRHAAAVDVVRLLRWNPGWTVKLVPRRQNANADHLARRALRGALDAG